jgi:hypothetical protein
MACAICKTRRPRRFCPGVSGDICTTCCGEEREVTVACPFDCEYLQEARKHEKSPIRSQEDFPNRDIRVTEEVLESNEALLVGISSAALGKALRTGGAVDSDVREALDSLIRTYRTLATGIYYETRPENRMAAELFDAMKDAIESFRKAESEQTGVHKTRDGAVLGLLVFLQHFAMDRDNGRRRGRSFLNALFEFYGGGVPGDEAPSPSTLILP